MYNTLSLKTGIIGSNIIHLPSCHSTNDLTFEMIRNSNIPEGTLVITDHQTAGKGQRGNKWEAEPGKNLTFSVLVKPDFLQPDRQFFLNIISSLAVSEVLTQFVPKKIKIKWPNDIYANSGKISGILIQNLIRNNMISHSVIGIGINVNQTVFHEPKATSIASLTGIQAELVSVLQDLLTALDKYYRMLKNKEFIHLRSAYLENLYWMKEQHVFRGESYFKGEICDVDEIGRLVIITEGEKIRFSFKEVEFIH